MLLNESLNVIEHFYIKTLQRYIVSFVHTNKMYKQSRVNINNLIILKIIRNLYIISILIDTQ